MRFCSIIASPNSKLCWLEACDAKKHDPGVFIYRYDYKGYEHDGTRKKDERDAHVRVCHSGLV